MTLRLTYFASYYYLFWCSGRGGGLGASGGSGGLGGSGEGSGLGGSGGLGLGLDSGLFLSIMSRILSSTDAKTILFGTNTIKKTSK